ncbi:MAG: TlyA family RNA methyltransferase [Clostridia bacterium]|nr:TlyA family RNA methyltransferase [Clostridia bacterium]
MAEKKRLDVALHEAGLTESRERAHALIMAGQVYVNGQKALKAGMPIKTEDRLEVRGEKMPYVSRGGYKLQKALDTFPLTLTHKICMDVGASTGGFTDCMLMSGADKVYAIDVGYGQLAWKLRSDERVVNLERTNFRYVTEEQVPDPIDFASVDVSFISLKLILPVLFALLSDNGEAVCLVKPQFEAGREKIGKKGVVRDRSVHREVIEACIGYAKDNGFSVQGLTFSPVKGPEGNIEYLLYLTKLDQPDAEISAVQVVEQSHQTLDHDKEEAVT